LINGEDGNGDGFDTENTENGNGNGENFVTATATANGEITEDGNGVKYVHRCCRLSGGTQRLPSA
jgi:hypothetical protein